MTPTKAGRALLDDWTYPEQFDRPEWAAKIAAIEAEARQQGAAEERERITNGLKALNWLTASEADIRAILDGDDA